MISTVVMDGQRAWCQFGAERPELGDASQSFCPEQGASTPPPPPHTYTRGAMRLYFQNEDSPLPLPQYNQQTITGLTSRLKRCSGRADHKTET